MMSGAEITYQPGTRENPFKEPITIKTAGPVRKIWCQLCPKQFEGPLHEARARLLDHYQEVHDDPLPKLHSFLPGESIDMAEHAAWQLRKVGP